MAVAHRRLLPTLALALLPVFTAVSCKADVSGMYIARFTNGVWWLQIVQTPDSRLSAQLETILLTKDDRVSREKISLSGAANGIGLTLSATTMGISVVTLSGQLEGARLTVTGGEPSPMVFVRSTLRDYASAVHELEGEAQLGHRPEGL